ncbi:MAG: hypothetical protein LBR73_00875 [Oscillospiraceae bacterium]|jgi:hypothetical protein|nr:hypothetical protein [Oscillospiraceae bacterium]
MKNLKRMLSVLLCVLLTVGIGIFGLLPAAATEADETQIRLANGTRMSFELLFSEHRYADYSQRVLLTDFYEATQAESSISTDDTDVFSYYVLPQFTAYGKVFYDFIACTVFALNILDSSSYPNLKTEYMDFLRAAIPDESAGYPETQEGMQDLLTQGQAILASYFVTCPWNYELAIQSTAFRDTVEEEVSAAIVYGLTELMDSFSTRLANRLLNTTEALEAFYSANLPDSPDFSLTVAPFNELIVPYLSEYGASFANLLVIYFAMHGFDDGLDYDWAEELYASLTPSIDELMDGGVSQADLDSLLNQARAVLAQHYFNPPLVYTAAGLPHTHTYTDWRSTTPATCTSPAIETAYCPDDDATEGTTRTGSAALGHSYGAWQTVTPATHTAAGLEERVCTHDAAHKETRPIERLAAHTYGAWVQTSAPTCTAAGTETRTCAADGATESRAGAPALGHNFGARHREGTSWVQECTRCDQLQVTPFAFFDWILFLICFGWIWM